MQEKKCLKDVFLQEILKQLDLFSTKQTNYNVKGVVVVSTKKKKKKRKQLIVFIVCWIYIKTEMLNFSWT